MLYAIINAVLFGSAFLIYWHRKKNFDLYCLISLVWTIVAILCAINVYQNPGVYELQLYPFLYLFVVAMILMSPFRNFEIKASSLRIEETFLIKALTWAYILTALFSIYYTFPNAKELLMEGDWAQLRYRLYTDPDSISLYGSSTEKLVKNISSYLSPFGIVIAFYQLSKKKINALQTFLLFAVWVVPAFLSATLTAARGSLAFLIMKAVLLYFLFRDSIPKMRKRYFYFFSVIVIIGFWTYINSVSESRFGEEEVGSSTFSYLGHSMLAFNDGLMPKMHDFFYGKYFLNYFSSFLGFNPDINPAQMGATFGTSFMTIIGAFYLDFGPVGTIIFSMLVVLLVARFTHKRTICLADLVVIVYFADLFMHGALVISRGVALSWFMVFVIYFIVKSSEKIR